MQLFSFGGTVSVPGGGGYVSKVTPYLCIWFLQTVSRHLFLRLNDCQCSFP